MIILLPPEGRLLAKRPLRASPPLREPRVTHAADDGAPKVRCGPPREGLVLTPAGEEPTCAACREAQGLCGWLIERRELTGGRVRLSARARWGDDFREQVILPLDVAMPSAFAATFAGIVQDALSVPPIRLMWTAGEPVPFCYTAHLGLVFELEVRYLPVHRLGAGWYGFVRPVLARTQTPMRLLGRADTTEQARWYFAEQLLRPWAVDRPAELGERRGLAPALPQRVGVVDEEDAP